MKNKKFNISLFLIIFTYLYICFKFNVYSFENLITLSEKKSFFGSYDVFEWELKFFEDKYDKFMSGEIIYNEGDKFINIFIVEFLRFIGISFPSFKGYYNLIVEIYIFLFSLFTSVILLKFKERYGINATLIYVLLLSFTIPIYIFLRSPTFFGPILLCFTSVVVMSFLKMNYLIHLIVTSLIYFICLYFSPANFFIYISILLTPYLFMEKNIVTFKSLFDLNVIKSYKIFLSFFLICFVTLICLLFSEFVHSKSEISFIKDLFLPKLKYYLFQFPCSNDRIICYLGAILGESRMVFDNFYTFIPFFHTGTNAYDGTISKEIRLFSPLNLTIIFFILIFIVKSKDLIPLRNSCFLGLFGIISYIAIFPYQIIAYQFTVGWLLFPYYIYLIAYVSCILTKFIKTNKFIIIIFFTFYLVSVYRFFTLENVKYLSF